MPEPVVSPALYDERYYTAVCGGHEEWTASDGQQGAPIYSVTLQQAGFEAGMVLVDVGTGRGEMLAVAAELGAQRALGVEYAPAGAALAARTVAARGVGDRAHVLQADARALPLPDGCADIVTMLDVIEHLSPAELDAALAEVHRVLKPGGLLVGHTFPTATIYDVTYRVLRRTWPGATRSWPADPRVEYEHLMHVNEQTVRGLRATVARAGFADAKVELGTWVYTDFVPSQRARGVYRALARWRLTRPLAAANIWVHARRH